MVEKDKETNKDKRGAKKKNGAEKDTEENRRPIIYVQRLSDGEHLAEAVLVGGIPAFLVQWKRCNIYN